ncbi:MAG: toprim domain-containing protein [Oscillospiraceae bacterium]|nr:toprim domain-containing protein [Oscillospiraceae bacterium]
MNREEAREELLTREPDFLETAKRKVNGHPTYICPQCGNGKGKDGDGIVLDTSSKSGFRHWKCFCCDLYADVLELWKLYTDVSDNAEAFRTAYDYYNIFVDDDYRTDFKAYSKPVGTVQGNFSRTAPTKTNKPSDSKHRANRDSLITGKSLQDESSTQSDGTAPEVDYTNFFLQANQNINKTNYHRGISLDTLNRFRIGYVERWRHPKVAGSVPTSPRLIIPTSKYSYLARDTRDNLTDTQKKYSKSKVGAVRIFNIEALQTAQKPIFIVEGEIDALSIIDVGGEAIALGSVSNARKLLEIMEKQKPVQPLIVSLDNDKTGTEATSKLIDSLQKLGIVYYQIDIAKPYKDANEALLADRELFSGMVEEIEQSPDGTEKLIQEEEYLKTSVANHLQEFVNDIAESVNTPYIPTKFKVFDTMLDGGLYEGLYIAGAISSLGKTTFVTQMCDQIAESGQEILIFSLEMARTELIAKSISRLTFLDVLKNNGRIQDAKTARGITTGSRYAKYSKIEKDLIQRSISNYGRYAENIFIHEGMGDIGIEQVRETVERHISITGRKPVVLIDYLQILAPTNDRATDKQNTDKAVLELKRISRDFKIPVIAISSFNRDNYNSSVSMLSFKESGAIEYSSDILIGLQLKGAGKKEFDVTTAKAKNPREIELVILKNRNGATGKRIQYKYYPMFNYFEEIGEIKEDDGEKLSIDKKTTPIKKGLVKID